MRKNRSKTKVAVLATALVVIAGGAAFAYWTAGGSGTGTAATGTSTALTVNQISVVAEMGPGVAAQPLSGDFDNTGDGPAYVTSVTASIASVTDALDAPIAGCDATDYTLTGAVMTVGHEVAAGIGVDAWTGATIAFNNKVTNQDACKLAVVHLAYSVI